MPLALSDTLTQFNKRQHFCITKIVMYLLKQIILLDVLPGGKLIVSAVSTKDISFPAMSLDGGLPAEGLRQPTRQRKSCCFLS